MVCGDHDTRLPSLKFWTHHSYVDLKLILGRNVCIKLENDETFKRNKHLHRDQTGLRIQGFWNKRTNARPFPSPELALAIIQVWLTEVSHPK